MSVNRSDVHLSKTLSWLLRHGALKEKLPISPEGYMQLPILLQHKSLRDKYDARDIKRVVDTNEKQRFTLRTQQGVLEIKANQGHSLPSVSQLDLIPITDAKAVEVIHGTYFRSWNKIKSFGLSRMGRNHIHFARGFPNDNKPIISGMRTTAQVYIYINLELALKEGIEFYESPNGVILSPGNETGFILPKYFLKVYSSEGQVLF